MSLETITMRINGEERRVEAHSMARLLDVLREDCLLTGSKEGCGEGECGSCSVLLNGELVNSCLVPALQAEGAEIVTIEGLEKTELGRRLQQAFSEMGGSQCGICTPGMVIAAYNLLTHNPQPSTEEIRVGLAGNLCRCTGYVKIFESVLAAASQAVKP